MFLFSQTNIVKWLTGINTRCWGWDS